MESLVRALNRFQNLKSLYLVVEPLDLAWFDAHFPFGDPRSELDPNLSTIDFRPVTRDEGISTDRCETAYRNWLTITHRSAFEETKKTTMPEVRLVQAVRPDDHMPYPNSARRRAGFPLYE